MRRSRLRIAVIGTRGVPGAYSGVERVAEHLYPRLAERGHNITVYCLRTRAAAGSATFRGVRRLELPALRWRSLETLSHSLLSTTHALLHEHFDVIQFEALGPGLLSGAGRLCAIPTVVRVHGLDWQRAKWGRFAARVLHAGEVAAVRHAEEIIVVSRELQHYFAQTYGRDVVHIPNGVPGTGVVCESAGSEALRRFGLERGHYFVFVGRLVPEKRIADVILAFQRIATPYRLAIVGASTYTEPYAKRLRALAAADPRVVFTGFQPAATVSLLLSHATAFVSPSELEGLPLSVLECLDHGVPAILSDIGPHRELIESVPGYDLFHPVGDVALLAAHMQRVLENPEPHRLIAQEARDLVRRTLSWSSIADRTEDVLLTAVERYKQRATARIKPRLESPNPAEARLV